jgi:hypothetical protein
MKTTLVRVTPESPAMASPSLVSPGLYAYDPRP